MYFYFGSLKLLDFINCFEVRADQSKLSLSLPEGITSKISNGLKPFLPVFGVKCTNH